MNILPMDASIDRRQPRSLLVHLFRVYGNSPRQRTQAALRLREGSVSVAPLPNQSEPWPTRLPSRPQLHATPPYRYPVNGLR